MVGDVLVGVGKFGECLTQVPGEVSGEHADEHVGAEAVFAVVVDGPQIEVVGFGDAEVPLDVCEGSCRRFHALLPVIELQQRLNI